MKDDKTSISTLTKLRTVLFLLGLSIKIIVNIASHALIDTFQLTNLTAFFQKETLTALILSSSVYRTQMINNNEEEKN